MKDEFIETWLNYIYKEIMGEVKLIIAVGLVNFLRSKTFQNQSRGAECANACTLLFSTED